MASFNRVILLGNITRDIEVKYLQSGTAVTELGLAVNEKYKNQSGEWVEDVVFVDVTLWGRTAEIAGEYLGKGSPVLIEGRLKLDKWEKDGQKHSKLRVTGERMQMVGSKGEGQGGRGGGGRGGGGSSQQGSSQQGSSQQGSSQQYDDGGDYGEPSGPPSRGQARSAAPAAPPPPTGDDIPF
jgi:single-strand DNA-binding protein